MLKLIPISIISISIGIILGIGFTMLFSLTTERAIMCAGISSVMIENFLRIVVK